MYIEMKLGAEDTRLRPCVEKAVHIATVTATPVRFRWLNAMTVEVCPRESVGHVLHQMAKAGVK